VNTIRLVPGDVTTDVAESAVAIDAANGMRVVVTAKAKHVGIRVTNTHASPHQVTCPAVQGAGNTRAVYGAAGPGGSNPTDPDYVSTAIPATTGVRWLSIAPRFFRSDGSYWLNFEAAHVGQILAVEFS
jgi:hypothetical protein